MVLGHENDHVWVYEVTEKETFAPRQKTPKVERQMTPEQTKATILLLAKPLDNFMREQGVAAFILRDVSLDSAEWMFPCN